MSKLIFTCIWALSILLYSCNSGEKDKQNEDKAAATSEPPHQIIVAGKSGNRYFVDENNNPLFGGAKFHNTFNFKNGYCIVSKMIGGKELRGVIDSTGKEVIPCNHDATFDNVIDGMVKFSSEGKFGYFDLTGKMVIPCEYTGTKGFYNGMVKLEKDYKKWGIIDKTGKVILPFEYEEISVWGNNMAAVKRNGSWGFINTAGQIVIPETYDFAWGFEKGVSLVGNGRKYALIDTNNVLITDYDIDDFQSIVNVRKNEFTQSGYSESNERLVMEEGLIIVSKNELWGLMNTKGETVLPFEYNSVDVPDYNGKVLVTKSDKYGYFDLKTKNISWP